MRSIFEKALNKVNESLARQEVEAKKIQEEEAVADPIADPVPAKSTSEAPVEVEVEKELKKHVEDKSEAEPEEMTIKDEEKD